MLHTQTSRRRQLTFCDAFIGFPAKWLLRNERRNSILMTCHYSDLASASDWLRQLYLGVQYHQTGDDTSSAWNFCAWSSGGISRGNQYWACQNVSCFVQATWKRMSKFWGPTDITIFEFFFFALLPTRLITGTSFEISELCKLQKVFWLHFLSLF